jgi:hypothetical protein
LLNRQQNIPVELIRTLIQKSRKPPQLCGKASAVLKWSRFEHLENRIGGGHNPSRQLSKPYMQPMSETTTIEIMIAPAATAMATAIKCLAQSNKSRAEDKCDYAVGAVGKRSKF